MSDTTKRAMAESLRKLLSARTLDRITVRDIVEDCGVNRQTFYYHFHDIFDLMEWSIEDKASHFFTEGMSENEWGSTLREMFAYLQENAALVLNAYHSQGWEYLATFIKARLRPRLEELAREEAVGMDIDEDDFSFVVDIYACAAFGIVDSWLADDMKTDYNRNIGRMLRLVSGSMRHALGKFDRRP